MIPAETIPGIGEEGIKENNGGGEYIRNIVRTSVNATMYPHPSQQ
jgi:hypothetical protein